MLATPFSREGELIINGIVLDYLEIDRSRPAGPIDHQKPKNTAKLCLHVFKRARRSLCVVRCLSHVDPEDSPASSAATLVCAREGNLPGEGDHILHLVETIFPAAGSDFRLGQTDTSVSHEHY